MEFSVASYNLWFNKAYSETSALAADNRLDILCLQECSPEGLTERLDRLKLAGTRTYTNGIPLEKTLSKSAKIDTFWKKGGMAIYYNTARLELIDIASHELSLDWSERKGGRFMQLARFRAKDGRQLAVANIHLSALWSTNRTRRKQLTEALSQLPEHMPSILAGDFNYPIASKGLRAFMDGYDMHECGTHIPSRTHTSRLIKGKFDHIFISDELEETEYTILPFGASDHAPVVTRLRFRPPAE